MKRQGTPPLDRLLIGDVVEREMHIRYGTMTEMVRAAQRMGPRQAPSRATLYRVLVGGEEVKGGTFTRVEALLRLPPGTLEAVGRHDIEELTALSVSEGLRVWVRHRLGLDLADKDAVEPEPSIEDAG